MRVIIRRDGARGQLATPPLAKCAGGWSLVAGLGSRGGGRRHAAGRPSDGPGSGVADMSHIRERLRRFLIRAMSRTHGGVYRASGGRLLGRVAGMPVLLLTTTGRESRKPRTAALTYFRDGADLVVIGSFGGSDLPPAWWLNLQRDSRASVLIGGTTSKVTARAASVEEHDRLWPLATTTHPGYARYQERTARLIPIVMLTPEEAEPRHS